MVLSELSIRRPVFATVLSLLLVILGVMATLRLPIREYPDVTSPVISVQTIYRGAAADIIESRVTQVLENELAGVEGIDEITSSSRDGQSSISITFLPSISIESAANDVRDRVGRVVAQLPDGSDPPQISKTSDQGESILVLGLRSSTLSALDLTDYAERYLMDRLSAVPGVAQLRTNGARHYAMRIWLDRQALAARGLTVDDIDGALRRENVQLPAGRIESREREFSLRTNTALRTEDDFRNLVIGRSTEGFLVRLREVAQVQLGAEDERSAARADGEPMVMLQVIPQSTANVLDVARSVKATVADLSRSLPTGMSLFVQIDNSTFIIESMKKVVHALAETLLVVLVVIFLFLGTVRATLIPAVTIPVSLLAATVVMALLGYSINTVTLLGAVLAIGLVVDDAIVVLENIVRRTEHGEPGLLAAISGSREIAFAVVATTLVLIAVFLPISYLQGTVGRMFSEFGVAVAAAVGFSALIALTLTPMMTSKLFAGGVHRGRLARGVDELFQACAAVYQRLLQTALRGRRPAWILSLAATFAGTVIALTLFGWPSGRLRLPQEFVPTEDRGQVRIAITTAEGSSFSYFRDKLTQVESIAQSEVEAGNAVRVISRIGNGNSGVQSAGGDVNTGMVQLPLFPWDERKDSAAFIAARLRAPLTAIPGANAFPQLQSGFSRGVSMPVQFVLEGPDYATLSAWVQRVLLRAARENPGIVNLDMDYKERKPQLFVQFDRNKAADLGVSMANVGSAVETMMGARDVTTFIQGGREYNVVLQARDDQRATVGDLDNIYVRSDAGSRLIPLVSVVNISEQAGPAELRRFNRQRAITISGNVAPGYSLGEALKYLERIAREEVGTGTAQFDYDGDSRDFRRSGSGLIMTFGFALIIVYLVLAAQFESFIHPLVILGAVPMALTGALIGLLLFGSTINVYSEIGAVMLVGIASKNGILIVEFANQLRDRGLGFLEAITQAAVIRLRPVLMTSLATAAGAVPLMLAFGAGAESRRTIGATVFFGVMFALLLTLLVVPALYALLARNTHSPHYVSGLIDRLRGTPPDATGGAGTPSAPAPLH